MPIDIIPQFGDATVTPMATPRAYTFQEGANWYLAERISLPNGAFAVRADVTNIDLAVYDMDSATPEVAIYTATALSTNPRMETALVVDGYWPYDTTGRNFLDTILATSLTARGDHRFIVEYVLNTVSYNKVVVLFIVKLEPTLGL